MQYQMINRRWKCAFGLALAVMVLAMFRPTVSKAEAPPAFCPEPRCDSDGDGKKDADWQCDTDGDAEKKNDACWSCDNNNDGKVDACKTCPDGSGGKACFTCDENGDGKNDACYKAACGTNAHGAYQCLITGFKDYADLKANCPAKGGIIKKNPAVEPSSNGCGSKNFPASPNPCGLDNTSFLAACDAHDHGYTTCNMTKKEADDKFKADLTKVCTDAGNPTCTQPNPEVPAKKCQEYADMYVFAVVTFGKASYEESQFSVCICCKE